MLEIGMFIKDLLSVRCVPIGRTTESKPLGTKFPGEMLSKPSGAAPFRIYS